MHREARITLYGGFGIGAVLLGIGIATTVVLAYTGLALMLTGIGLAGAFDHILEADDTEPDE